VIEQKYLTMLDRLNNDSASRGGDAGGVRLQPDRDPGFFARRRRILPPANDVLAALPSGAVIDGRPAEVGHYVSENHAAVS